LTGTFKFPHTPLLAWLGEGGPRADKVLSPDERASFLRHPVVVEEKVDGANVGISFDASLSLVVRNRGAVLGAGAHPQFQALWPWLAQRRERLAEALESKLVLFGEWCFAVHSVRYDRLPDYFLTIDVYDTQMRMFWSADRRDELARNLGLAPVPRLGDGRFTLQGLRQLLGSTTSHIGSEPMEGLYLRWEERGWLQERAKLVRPEFAQAIEEHWTSRPLERNAVTRAPMLERISSRRGSTHPAASE